MNVVSDKIKQVLEEKRYSVRQFSQSVGMNATTIGRQLKGEQAMSLALIAGVLNLFPDLSAEWLLRGRGEMYLDAQGVMEEPDPNESLTWQAKYEELEKRYNQLLGALSASMAGK